MTKDESSILPSNGNVGGLANSKTMIASFPAILRSLWQTLKPSFMTRRNAKPRRLHSTSYLDGLRGLAALLVVINHIVSQYFSYLSTGFGAPGDNYRLLQLPILRIVYTGRFMVLIFFGISGYVLSHKALGLMRQHQPATLLKSLSSSVFRRWMRLMLPAIASSFISLLIVMSGMGTVLHPGWDQNPPLPPNPEDWKVGGNLPEPKNTTSEQLSDWFVQTHKVANPFEWSLMWPIYNVPLWTITVEFVGSMMVFITLVSISFTRRQVRFIILIFLSVYAFTVTMHMWSMFFVGMVLAERDHRLKDDLPKQPSPSSEDIEKPAGPAPQRRHLRQSVWPICMVLVALYLGSFPEFSAHLSPGYKTLSKLILPTYETTNTIYWPTIGAAILLYALESAKFLQSIFITPFIQYLGDISLSMYMLHVLIELSFLNWVVPICLNMTRALPGGFALAMFRKSYFSS